MTPSDEHSHDWHRLHPATLPIRFAVHLRALILPAALVFLLARSGTWEYWVMILFLPSIAYELFHYFTLRYRLADDEIIVREGLIFRNERHVRFRRIQNIDLVQGPLHRLFGVADVRIETAGGTKPEAVLRTLSLAAVEPMRERVFGSTSIDHTRDSEVIAPPQRESRELLRLSGLDLVKVGLISGRGSVLLAVWHARRETRILSYAQTDHGIMFRSGVLTPKISATFFEKMQVISLSESPFDRRYDMASLQVGTAGAGPAEHRIDVPYLERAAARQLLDQFTGRLARATSLA